MTDHDQRGCLRCGNTADDSRFCESCRSQFVLFLERPVRLEALATDEFSLVAPMTRELALTPTMDAGRGGHDDPRPEQSLGVGLHEGALEPDQGAAAGAQRAGQLRQPEREVARFEEVLTPAELDAELEAHRRADAAGDPEAATKLGILLEQRGDREGALAAYRRADRRGAVSGSFNLGCLLAEMGELEQAQAALKRADERGDAAAASNLGVLLERHGDMDGALAAYRRADERGDAIGAFNLGLLLVGKADVEGAQAAYLRAAERGDLELRERAVQAAADAALAAVKPESPARREVPARPAPVATDTIMPGEPRTDWVRVVCVAAVLGLAVVLVIRRRRRSR